MEFHQGDGDFLDDINLFLEGRIPWEKNSDMVSERKEQNLSYFCKGFSKMVVEEIKE